MLLGQSADSEMKISRNFASSKFRTNDFYYAKYSKKYYLQQNFAKIQKIAKFRNSPNFKTIFAVTLLLSLHCIQLPYYIFYRFSRCSCSHQYIYSLWSGQTSFFSIFHPPAWLFATLALFSCSSYPRNSYNHFLRQIRF